MNHDNEKALRAGDFPAADIAPAAPEFAVAAEPVKRAGGFKLIKPLSVDGREVTELHLDFDGLSAADMLNIEQEMMTSGVVAMKNAAFSAAYCLYIAARACGVNINDLKRLSFRDSDRLVQETQNFMLASASTE